MKESLNKLDKKIYEIGKECGTFFIDSYILDELTKMDIDADISLVRDSLNKLIKNNMIEYKFGGYKSLNNK